MEEKYHSNSSLKHSHHEVAERIGAVEVVMSFHVIGEFSDALITHVLL